MLKAVQGFCDSRTFQAPNFKLITYMFLPKTLLYKIIGYIFSALKRILTKLQVVFGRSLSSYYSEQPSFCHFKYALEANS